MEDTMSALTPTEVLAEFRSMFQHDGRPRVTLVTRCGVGVGATKWSEEMITISPMTPCCTAPVRGAIVGSATVCALCRKEYDSAWGGSNYYAMKAALIEAGCPDVDGCFVHTEWTLMAEIEGLAIQPLP